MGFWRRNPVNGGQDIFWQARDNALLIKGGANYAYDQINDELSKFLARPAAKGGVSVLHAVQCRAWVGWRDLLIDSVFGSQRRLCDRPQRCAPVRCGAMLPIRDTYCNRSHDTAQGLVYP